MKKPTVYLDTSTISAYWYEGDDVATQARRLHTRAWWQLERPHFVLRCSAFVEAELEAGTFPRQRHCLKMVRRISYLTVTAQTRQLIDEVIRLKVVPANKEADAAHLAIAVSHGMDYLLTWNYAHMANASVQAQLEELCEAAELLAPLMVSPESIPQVRFGQTIRRSR